MDPSLYHIFTAGVIVTVVMGLLFSLLAEFLAGRTFAHAFPVMTLVVSVTSAVWAFPTFGLGASVLFFILGWVGWAIYCGMFPDRSRSFSNERRAELIRSLECLEDRIEHKRTGTLRQALAFHDELEDAQGVLSPYVMRVPGMEKPDDVRDESHLEFTGALLTELIRDLREANPENEEWRKHTLALIRDLYVRIGWILE